MHDVIVAIEALTWDDLGNYTTAEASFSSSRLRKSRSMAVRSASIDFRDVCDPYIRIAPDTRGRVASPTDESEQCRIDPVRTAARVPRFGA